MKANILSTLRNLHNDESGQDLIEYALVASLIAFAAVTTMGKLATNVNTAFSKLTSAKSNAANRGYSVGPGDATPIDWLMRSWPSDAPSLYPAIQVM